MQSVIINNIRHRLAAEYDQAMHGYAKGWHLAVALVAIVAAIWVVQMLLGDSSLFHGGTGDPYYR